MTVYRLALDTLIFALALSVSLAEAGPDIDQIFKTGNEFYSRGDFKSAIAQYRKIEQSPFVNEAVYYNLGNAYFKEGRLGYTILYYEKARRITPNDPELHHNLELARSQITDQVTGPPDDFLSAGLKRMVMLLPIDLVTQLALTFFLIGSSSFTLFLLWNSLRGRQLCLFFSALFLLLFLLTSLLNAVQIYRQTSSQEAIVSAQEAAVTSGPGDDHSTLFEVHEGLKVRIRNEVKGWMQVSLENGWSGWIKSDALGRI